MNRIILICLVAMMSCAQQSENAAIEQAATTKETDVLSNYWKQIKKHRPLTSRRDTLPEQSTYIRLEMDSIFKIQQDSILYSYQIQQDSLGAQTFYRGAHEIYYINDSVLSIIYFSKEGATEVYQRMKEKDLDFYEAQTF